MDVHLKSWSVTILSETSVLKKYSQDASPEALHKTLTMSYPDAEYYTPYMKRASAGSGYTTD